MSNAQTNALKYRRDIDGLRALAVLSVVGFHVFGVRGGFIGVDIFFVISGFLISTIILTNLENNNFSFAQFYARRVKRIFPALILVLSFSFIIGWFILLPDEYEQLGKHIAGASIFISNFLLWSEAGYFDKAAITKPLLHLWSLGVEEQFYIIWPLLLWITWKKKFNLIYTIALVALISFLLNIKGAKSDQVAVFYSPHTRFWELLCGSFVAWLTLFKEKQNGDRAALCPFYGAIFSFVGMGFIIIGLVALTKDNFFHGPLALLPTLGTALIILAGQQAWINRVILSRRTLVWFGLISFPLYLWHWPLLVFAKLSISDGIVSSTMVKILSVLLSIVLAWLTYKLIESPIRFGNKNKIKTLILMMMIGIVGGFGYLTYFNQGFYFRVPEILQDSDESAKYARKYRLHSCFQRDNNTRFHFSACEMTKEEAKPTIILWGDSHAAHFYAGYKDRFGKKFNVVLISETGCRPLLKNKSLDKKCYEINNYILDLIQKEKPYKIVLSASWAHHDDWMSVTKTINQLKTLGVHNIDLIGPAPDWVNTLPRQLFIYSHLDKHHQIPTRMSFGLDRYFLKVDRSMEKIALNEKVSYISLAKILCNNDGCITRVGEKLDNLISLDYGHFTEHGSVFVVSSFPNIVA